MWSWVFFAPFSGVTCAVQVWHFTDSQLWVRKDIKMVLINFITGAREINSVYTFLRALSRGKEYRYVGDKEDHKIVLLMQEYIWPKGDEVY